MVFTVPMDVRPGTGHPRRAVLATLVSAAAGTTLSGCWGSVRPAGPPKPHPLEPTLAGTLTLVGRYQTTISTYADLGERLGPLLENHRAHVDALRRAMGTPNPTGSPTVSASAAVSVAADPAAALAELRTAEQTGQTEASTACLAAAAEHAALLGSIAACRATHVEVLAG
jgi:hypothetical protein